MNKQQVINKVIDKLHTFKIEPREDGGYKTIIKDLVISISPDKKSCQFGCVGKNFLSNMEELNLNTKKHLKYLQWLGINI
jgi:hypothetical protein